MRFSEFQVKPRRCIDFGQHWLEQMDSEDCASIPLRESEQGDTDEILSFISQYTTNLNDLVLGEKYYTISLAARPNAKILRVECSDIPVVYAGHNKYSFEFGDVDGDYYFQLPINYVDVEHEYGPRLISTILYATVDECNKLLTHIGLQFTGRWKVIQNKLQVIKI